MSSLRIPIRQLDPELPLPSYARPGDAGLDLIARTATRLAPRERSLVPTGIAIAIPEGWVGLVHPRSGMAVRHGVTVLNAPGTIDAGYRGEIFVNLINLDANDEVDVHRGDRIAQLLVQQVEQVDWDVVSALPGSVRGETGHGSTGGFAGHR